MLTNPSETDLRDYFAAAAMMGILAKTHGDIGIMPMNVAMDAYLYADAMLLERRAAMKRDETQRATEHAAKAGKPIREADPPASP